MLKFLWAVVVADSTGADAPQLFPALWDAGVTEVPTTRAHGVSQAVQGQLASAWSSALEAAEPIV